MILMNEAITRTYRTAADIAQLQVDLGDIPAERIRLFPTPGTATEEDCVHAVEDKLRSNLVELVRGTLVEKTVGYEESLVGQWLGIFVAQFVYDRRLGVVVGADGMHRMQRGNILEPDIAFTAWQDMPDRQRPRGIKVFPTSPSLAIEVLSKWNMRSEMANKRIEYFASITRQVWEVDPFERTIDIYTSPETFSRLTSEDVLDGGDVLPGFRVPVAEVFAVLDKSGE